MEAELVHEQAEFDPHSVEHISCGDWEDILQRFTQDMDPWDLDIVKLADRYKSYIQKLERFDLEIPGRIILIGAVLLRMKTEVLRREYADEEAHRAEDELAGMFEFEEDLAEVEEEQLRIPDAIPTPPVKKKGKRKVTLDELKNALRNALVIEDRRQARQVERTTVEEYGIEVEEQDFTDRLDGLYHQLKGFIEEKKDAVTFSRLVAADDKREMIETFVNVMHLETEERVRCIQDEFLGELEIEVVDS